MNKINALNQAIAEWFAANRSTDKIAAKELMPLFISKGIFNKNHRDGLPLRTLLRTLDEKNQLGHIPSLLVERNAANRKWYFVRGVAITAEAQLPEPKVSEITVSALTKQPLLKCSFEPIVDDRCRILILGSLPGDISL